MDTLKIIRVTSALLLSSIAAHGTTVNSTWSTASGATGADGPVAATVTFSLSSCIIGSCSLNIAITNLEANPTAAGQLISDLSFVLANGSTKLTSPGSLSNTISNGSGGSVTVLDSSFNATTTTTLPTTWQFGSSGSGFLLNDLTGGSPANMIIGPGPYTNANPSITGHSPSLAGTVLFTITGFSGLKSTTLISDVEFSFGTGPDSFSPGELPTPEPVSFVLAATGLIGIYFFRRRRRVE
jgi:hypothetical protein